jgi:hypothetical protein
MIIRCRGCGWKWNLSKGGYDPYICHKCGMNNRKYYNNRNVGVVPIVAVAAAKPIASLVSAGIAALPGIIKFIRNISQRPAGEARDVINAVKKEISNTDPRNRLALVVAASQRNFKAADVDVNELLYWYRQNYADDYLQLLPEDKLYWNTYLDNYRQRFLLQRPDLQNSFLNRSYFTKEQINYKPQTSKTPGTPGTQKAGMNIWLTLGIVGAGIFLITKMKK